MIFNSIKRALVLAPHTDDGEFGCGATIDKLIKSGVEVYYIAFSYCEESVPEGFAPDVLKHEAKRATKKLGINSENVFVLDYKVRYFSYKRQEILEDLIVYRRKINPDLIFIPSVNDVHQDHATIANEAIRAFKNRNILSYELPWNNFKFSMDLFVEAEESSLDIKIDALKEYESQVAIRGYASEEFIKSLARVRGTQVGKDFAEVFEVVRLIN
ncbi:PIG-L deacetylase family protein [Pseudofulvibacter geojedonensis]|uniref:PIG-L deacetylase family protein n=1 Tax=Pseudofulvibacter geojedonensis TaxID=1123758 RepID=A0ABW3I407_9FLAO